MFCIEQLVELCFFQRKRHNVSHRGSEVFIGLCELSGFTCVDPYFAGYLTLLNYWGCQQRAYTLGFGSLRVLGPSVLRGIKNGYSLPVQYLRQALAGFHCAFAEVQITEAESSYDVQVGLLRVEQHDGAARGFQCLGRALSNRIKDFFKRQKRVGDSGYLLIGLRVAMLAAIHNSFPSELYSLLPALSIAATGANMAAFLVN